MKTLNLISFMVGLLVSFSASAQSAIIDVLHGNKNIEFNVYDYKPSQGLLDEYGRKIELKQFKGRDAIVTMEYSNCKMMCSITTYRLKQLHDLARQLGKSFEFIIFSLDPNGDTPAAWSKYRQLRGLPLNSGSGISFSQWHFINTTQDEMPILAKLLGIRWWYYDGAILHDFKLMRINEKGVVTKIMDVHDGSQFQFLE